jgi:phosphonate transport system ATP-binding protein
MLKFECVSKIYDDRTVAVNCVSIDINKAEFCVLLGSSGAGKTTLLRMVNGLVRPTTGNVKLDGELVSKKTLKHLRPRIAMIHQQLDLVQRLTVLNNVLSGALSAIPLWRSLIMHFPMSLRRKACYLLDQVGLKEEHLYRRVATLSGGQQQRVAIARAFVLDPEIVLADEPVASLDPVVSQNILKILKATSRQYKTTVLCSLHQVEYAIEVADRIIGVSRGNVIFDGVPENLTAEILEEIYEGTSHTPVLQQPRESFDTLLSRQTLADPSVRVEIIV